MRAVAAAIGCLPHHQVTTLLPPTPLPLTTPPRLGATTLSLPIFAIEGGLATALLRVNPHLWEILTFYNIPMITERAKPEPPLRQIELLI